MVWRDGVELKGIPVQVVGTKETIAAVGSAQFVPILLKVDVDLTLIDWQINRATIQLDKVPLGFDHARLRFDGRC